MSCSRRYKLADACNSQLMDVSARGWGGSIELSAVQLIDRGPRPCTDNVRVILPPANVSLIVLFNGTVMVIEGS